MTKQTPNRVWKLLGVSGLYFREVVGWGLMLLGLQVFRICLKYLNFAAVIEGFVAATIGIVIFRSGLQLVKVSVAARVVRSESSATHLPGKAV